MITQYRYSSKATTLTAKKSSNRVVTKRNTWKRVSGARVQKIVKVSHCVKYNQMEHGFAKEKVNVDSKMNKN